MIFSPFKTNLLVCILIIISTLIAYQGVFHNGFVGYDDTMYISGNEQIRNGLNINGVLWAFSSSFDANWFPLTLMSHMIDITLFGTNAFGHHLVNLSLHIANALLLYLILVSMTGQVSRSAVVAALFALHPLHVESVAWVAERKDVLSTLFFMLTVGAYLRFITKRTLLRYFPVMFLYLCGLASKPMLVSLPLVLLLLDFWPLRRLQFTNSGKIGVDRIAVSALFLEKIPLIICSTASCVITYNVQKSGGAVNSFIDSSISENSAHTVLNYVSYLHKSFWPADLAVLYPYVHEHPFWEIGAATALLTLITIISIWQHNSKPYLTVGWLWFLITMLPVIGIVRIGVHSIADRYTYIPLTGVFIMVVWWGADVLKLKHWGSETAVVITFLLLVLLGYATHKQTTYWKDSFSLYEHTLNVTDNNWIIHNNYASVLINAGMSRKALWHLNEAVRIAPNYTPALLNLGNLLRSLDDMPGAIRAYRSAIEQNPNLANVYYQLSITYSLFGERSAAFETCAALERVDPSLARSLKKRLLTKDLM